jgi:hypothetical protein
MVLGSLDVTRKDTAAHNVIQVAKAEQDTVQLCNFSPRVAREAVVLGASY